MRLRPDDTVTPEDLARGERALVKDAAWATTAGALYGGVILVGFALELGASSVIIGLLAAIPFLAQISQLAAIVLIERVRQRRKIVLLAVTVARTLILSLALVAFAEGRLLQLSLLVVVQAAISLSGAIAGCAFNGWVHEVVPRETLGTLFSRRLFWSTVLSSLGALSAGYLVQAWPVGDRLQAYAIAFVAAGAAGFMSSHYLLRVPEPPMRRTGPPLPLTELLRAPLVDANFRKVVAFMAAWNLASNVAAPFITVYLVRQIGYELGTVTTTWAVGQIATALTMAWWGRLSDRLSNKAILNVALPAYFASLIALAFIALPERHAYLAAVTLAGSLAAGLAALSGGVLANWFAARELALSFSWTSPGITQQITVLQFRHWEFLFAISFALGFYALHRLSCIQEGEEHSERTVIQHLVIEAFRSIDQLSPIEGLRTVILMPLGRLRDRRLRPR